MSSGEVETLRRLVEIPSPTGYEGDAVAYLAERMDRLGYRVRVDAAGNVIGELGAATGPVLLLVGHVDTVPGGLDVREAGGVLHGRGTVDAKGPLAAMVHAAARAAGPGAAAPFPGRVVVAGAVDEEGLSRGARHLAARLDAPDALIIGEPSGADGVVVGYQGMLALECRVHRPAAHTSTPAERAGEIVCGLWHELRDRLDGEYRGRALFDRVRPALLAVTGDTTVARAVVSCRTPLDFAPEELIGWLRGRADAVEVVECVPAVRTSRADPLVRAFAATVRNLAGTARTLVKLGTSDMNVLAPYWRVPAVAYGPGDSALDHTDHEHISLEEYLLATNVLAEALPAVAAGLPASGAAEGVVPT